MHVKMTGDAGILAPPLTVGKDQIDAMVGKLREVLATY